MRDQKLSTIGRPTKQQRIREWAAKKSEGERLAADVSEYQATEQTEPETPAEKKNGLRRWECENPTCGNVVWQTTFEQRALCGRCYQLDGRIARMLFAPIGPSRPRQKPIPPHIRAKQTEVPF